MGSEQPVHRVLVEGDDILAFPLFTALCLAPGLPLSPPVACLWLLMWKNSWPILSLQKTSWADSQLTALLRRLWQRVLAFKLNIAALR